MVLGCKTGIIDSQEKEAPIEPTYYWKASDIAQADASTVSTWTDRTASKTANGLFDTGGQLPQYYTSIDPYPCIRLTSARKNRITIPQTSYPYTTSGFAIFVVVKFTNNYPYQRCWEMYAFNPSKFIFGEYYRSSGSIYSGQFGSVAFFPNTTINAGSGTSWTSNWYVTAMLYNGDKTCYLYNHATNTWLSITVATKPTLYDLEINISDTGTVCDMNIREVRIYNRVLTTAQGQAEVDKILALYP